MAFLDFSKINKIGGDSFFGEFNHPFMMYWCRPNDIWNLSLVLTLDRLSHETKISTNLLQVLSDETASISNRIGRNAMTNEPAHDFSLVSETQAVYFFHVMIVW